MIKEIKAQKEVVVERHKYCDICGTEVPIGLACSAAKCSYCGRDLCESHIGHEEETGGDYRVVYCTNCWELGNEYRPKIETLNKEVGRLYAEWRNKCKRTSK